MKAFPEYERRQIVQAVRIGEVENMVECIRLRPEDQSYGDLFVNKRTLGYYPKAGDYLVLDDLGGLTTMPGYEFELMFKRVPG